MKANISEVLIKSSVVLKDFVSPFYVISALIIITPFTMGNLIPFISYYSIIIAWLFVITLLLLQLDEVIYYKAILPAKLRLPIILFVLSFFISIFFGQSYKKMFGFTDYDSTLMGVLKDVLSFVPMQVLLIFLIYLSIKKYNDIIKFFNVLLINSLIINFIGLALHIIYKGSAPGAAMEGRLSSVYLDPNYLGRFEVFIIIISLCYILFYKKTVFTRFLLLGNVIFSLFILYLTFSRSAIITLTVSIIIITFYLKKKILRFIVIGFIVVAMLFLYLSVASKRSDPSMSVTTSNAANTLVDVSNTTRLALNYASLKIFLDYPIFGVGYHNFYNIYINKNYVPIDIPTLVRVSVVHSWLFAVMAEQGLIGLMPLLWIIFFILLYLYKHLKIINNQIEYITGLILLIVFFAFIFNGLFFPTFFHEIEFAILAGLVGGYIKLSIISEHV